MLLYHNTRTVELILLKCNLHAFPCLSLLFKREHQQLASPTQNLDAITCGTRQNICALSTFSTYLNFCFFCNISYKMFKIKVLHFNGVYM
jgi:hypothetical protein